MRSGPAWLPIVIALVLGAAVTGARYYHRDANQKLRAASRVLDDRSESATAFINRLPRDRHPLREAGLPAKSEEATALLQLYHLLSLDGLQSRLLFGLLAPDAPEWGPDTVMSYARWTMLSRLHFELERGRFEAVRLLGQRFINLVNAMGPADYFLLLDGDLRTSRRVVQVTSGRYLYDDEAMSRRVLRALIVETVAIPPAGTESVELVLGDDIAYANARARAARSARYTEKRAIWEEFLTSQGESRRRPEAAFNVIDATMNAFRDIPSKDPDHLVRARADSRLALDLCRDFVRQYPDSYLTDDALRYLLRLAFSLGESDQVLDAYIRLARLPGSPDAFKRTQYGLMRWFIDKDKAPSGEARATSDWLAEQARRPSTAAVSGASAVLERISRLLDEADPQALGRASSHEVLGRVLMKWLHDRHAAEGVRTSWEAPTR